MKENIVDKLQMMVRLIDNEACATVLYIDFWYTKILQYICIGPAVCS